MVIAGMLSITDGNAQINTAMANNVKLFPMNIIHNEQDLITHGKDMKLIIEASSDSLTHIDATVKIYNDSGLVAVLNNSMGESMEVELKNNSYYVIEVFSTGYISKSVLVSTTNTSARASKHKVSILLNKQHTFANTHGNNSVPLTGIIYYDQEQGGFTGSAMLNESPDNELIIAQLNDWFEFTR